MRRLLDLLSPLPFPAWLMRVGGRQHGPPSRDGGGPDHRRDRCSLDRPEHGRDRRPTGSQSVHTPSPSAASSPAPASPAVTLQSYRAARDAYCTPANTRLISLNAQGGALDPAGSAADRTALIAILQQTISLGDEEVAFLAALQAPSEIAADHAADVVQHRDSIAILREALALLQAGKMTEANAVSDATATLSSSEEAFESKYGLAACP